MDRGTFDLRLLGYFFRTAQVGNITRAAAELNVAQPTLSKALKLLEDQVGTPLMERHAHGITLTPIGARLAEHAGVVIAQVRDASDEIAQLRSGKGGHVRIGAGPSWVRRKLPEAISRITEQRPDVLVEVQTGFDESLLRGLTTGALDFVVAERPLEGESANLEFRLLTADDLVCVGRPEHRLAGRKNVPATEALAMAWALPPEDTLARRKLDGRVISLGLTPPRAMVMSTSLTFLLTHATLTDALIYTTRSQLLSAEGSRLIEIDVPELVTHREAGLIYRKPGLLTPAARAITEALIAECQADPFN
ncbi:LysR family transcriptional regulator [Paracoccus sp. Z330]|uniref:LysR family transcriptional regulator n=1 Tax=Paracoccus onchidii TaxID=3017813 RepID=A0ABT4ZFT9_9RHOB|nr:LysR family transcriptional regulator [Paracoccus onchidii]MDB6178244.1 LysR family transcriptional regulator [Paracoccus onchidii]